MEFEEYKDEQNMWLLKRVWRVKLKNNYLEDNNSSLSAPHVNGQIMPE